MNIFVQRVTKTSNVFLSKNILFYNIIIYIIIRLYYLFLYYYYFIIFYFLYCSIVTMNIFVQRVTETSNVFFSKCLN